METQNQNLKLVSGVSSLKIIYVTKTDNYDYTVTKKEWLNLYAL